MSELLVFTFAGAIAGAAIGGGLVAWLAFRRGAFKPTVNVLIAGHPGAPIEAVSKPDETVLIHPRIRVDWDVVASCAKGSGMALVPEELVPPRH
jgi:hypothetical protein